MPSHRALRPARHRRQHWARTSIFGLVAASLLAAATPPSLAAGDTAPELLTQPYLQLPTRTGVTVAWVTEFPGERHRVLVGDDVADLTTADVERFATAPGRRGMTRDLWIFDAESAKLSRTFEDADSHQQGVAYSDLTRRPLWRHEVRVRGLSPGGRSDYRVLSVAEDGEWALSDTYTLAPLPRRGTPQKILLTSDHQLKRNTPANLQNVVETVGRVDAVFLAGDLVNVADRASEWFDDEREFSFFPGLQGTAEQQLTIDGQTATHTGGEILQHAPLYSVVGNHEVMGRRNAGDLGAQFNSPLPIDVAEKLHAETDPSGTSREQWIEDHSFNIDTYAELFTLPTSRTGGESYYAQTIGNVRLISLYATKIWRGKNATRDATGAFREATDTHGEPMDQGWGEHIFEPIAKGSEQYEWLERELRSPETRRAEVTVVMMHEAVHSLGANVLTPFTDPVRIEERNADGDLVRIRYEYPREQDQLRGDLKELLEGSGVVDLVLNGHSHLWNRFESPNGVDYLETSNVGNSYGAYAEGNGRSRPVPLPPWNPANYTAQGDPGGLEAIVPNVAPFTDEAGNPQPYVASNDVTVFSILDTGAGTVTSYAYDLRRPDQPVRVLDRFSLNDE